MEIAHFWSNYSGSLQELFPRATFAGAVPEYDIVVAMIQSNMRGVATDWNSGDQYANNIFMWNHSFGAIVPAIESQSMWETGTGMGASNTFLKDYAANSLAAGRRLLVVNVARGGTGFTTPSSNPSGTGFHWRYDLTNDANNLARRSVEVVQTVLAAAGSGSRIVAFLANHGSTDGTNNTPKATFKGYLQAWINWLRTTLSVPTVPYVMMQMRPNLIADETRHRIIDEAQIETASEMSFVGHALSPVGSTYYKPSPDSVHFNAAGMRAIGHSLYDEFLTLMDKAEWRDSLVPGSFLPSSLTNGIYSSLGDLTPTAGSTISSSGGTYENIRFTSKVTVTGSNNTFRNCYFAGTTGSLGDDIGEAVLSTGTGNTFKDCTITSNTKNGIGITGRFFTLIRAEIFEIGDGIRIQPQGLAAGNRVDVTLIDVWVHDLVMWNQAWPSGYNVTHNDCIQWLGGAGLIITGGRYEAFYSPNYGHWNNPDVDSGGTGSANHVSGNHYRVMNSQYGACIMFNREGSSDSPAEFVCSKAWFNGGPTAFNMGDVALTPLSSSSSVTNCHFGYDFKPGTSKPRTVDSTKVVLGGGTAYVWSGNSRWGASSWTEGTLTDPGGGSNYTWTPSGSSALVDPFDTSVPLGNEVRNQ